MTYVTGHCEVLPSHRPSPQSDPPWAAGSAMDAGERA